MSLLIRLYKIIALLLWSVCIGLATMPYQLSGGWSSIDKIGRLSRLWSKGVAKIINLRVKIRGELPPDSGGLVVSNHLSYIDIIAHGSTLPLRYSPKSDIAGWPVLGWYIGLSRPIWSDRRSKQSAKNTLKAFAETMSHGMFLIVYPEGTSTDGKGGILPFKSTAFEGAITAAAPVYPILTRYKEIPAELSVCWYGDMTLFPHIWQMLKRSSIEVELSFLPPILQVGMTRKELAAFVHTVMEKEYLTLTR